MFLSDLELVLNFGGTVAVVVADTMLAANGTPEFEYLGFVQFGAAIATEKKEALGFLRHFWQLAKSA